MQGNVTEVVLVTPRGFCAGVEMAIKALAWMVRAFPAPVYCYHEIVHNKIVVDHFREAGVIFVDDIAEVPVGAPLMLSAHGSSPAVVAAAKANGGFVVDAVCPLVTKVHHEAKTRAGKGFNIVYIGHEGHDEAVGTMAVAPDAMHLVETVSDVAALELDGPVALLAQTTLSHFDWADVQAAAQEKFPHMWVPGHSDLCYATTNRQSALKTVSAQADAVIVVGSQNSSNTVALAKVATATGAPRVVRINTVDEVPTDLSGQVVVTSGASAPDGLVQAIVAKLAPPDKVRHVRVIDEDEYFPLPRGLRDFVSSVAAVWAYGLGAPVPVANPAANDREVFASDVLTSLSPASAAVAARASNL
jgi:4-hydroxy-3-methylbut-2-en-1-yl diphosphate reductase